ncbi:hypothetical protein MHBO_000889 [Bonamia ostreae]|uniref:TATA-box-binding protein n=1 Tax=Bonamia ostreae TaxID=126728 RepID=A0ABV2AH55_9EUKA
MVEKTNFEDLSDLEDFVEDKAPTVRTERIKNFKWEKEPEINNVFAEAFLGCEINLRQCAKKILNFEYPHENTSHGLLSLKKPRASVHVHHGGKLIVIGMPSLEAAKLVLRKCARRIQRIHKNALFGCFNVTQSFGSGKLRQCLDLEKMAKSNKFAIFNPEINSSLLFQKNGSKMTVYKNGTITCSSVSSGAFFDAFEDLLRNFNQFLIKSF